MEAARVPVTATGTLVGSATRLTFRSIAFLATVRTSVRLGAVVDDTGGRAPLWAGASGAWSAAASRTAAGSGSPMRRSRSARLRSVGHRCVQLPVRAK